MEVIKTVDVLVHFFIKELEHTWRNKFADCKEFINILAFEQLANDLVHRVFFRISVSWNDTDVYRGTPVGLVF